MRKNGTLTKTEQTKELARIDAALKGVRASLSALEKSFDGVVIPEAVGAAWNALHDAENALCQEHRRVWLNTPQSAVDRMMANVD